MAHPFSYGRRDVIALASVLMLTACGGVLPQMPRTQAAGELERSRTACGWGRADDCLEVGVYLDGAGGGARDPAAAYGFFERACEAGEPSGCTRQALLHAVRDPTPMGLARAEELLYGACADGDAEGCLVLGRAYDAGTLTVQDDAKAAAAYRSALERDWRACEGKDAAACARAASMFMEGRGVAPDPAGAIRLHEEACVYGAPASCATAGEMYEQGAFVKRHRGHAKELHRQGIALLEAQCDAGWFISCRELGLRYYAQPDGVYSAPAKAERVLRRACSARLWDACTVLSSLYYGAEGVTSAPARARALLEEACRGGHRPACDTVGSAEDEAP